MNISWHDPELYYFLSLLTGIAALLASLYGFSSPRRRNRAKPLDIVDQPPVKPLPRAVPVDRGQQVLAGHQSPPATRLKLRNIGPASVLRDRSLPTEEKHVREKIDESPRPAGEQAAEIQSALRGRREPLA